MRSWVGLVGMLVAACGGHTANDTSEPERSGGTAGSAVIGGGGQVSPGTSPGSSAGGIALMDPLTGGSGSSGSDRGGTSSTPLPDGCDCAGDGFGASVRLGDEQERLDFNRPEEARCAPGAPAHADITSGCARDQLSLWLGHDADGAVPRLTVLGSAVTYVDRAGITWTGLLESYQTPLVDASFVLVDEIELTVSNESGETRTLRVSYKLCVRYLPRALVVC